MEKSVSQQITALSVFMETTIFVSLSLRGVFLQQLGAMINAKLVVITAHTEPISIQVHAILKLHVRMDSNGIPTSFNVYALRVLAGMVSNVFSV